MRTTKTIAASLVAAAAFTTLAACSSDPAETATSAIAAASDAAANADMVTLCEQMVADGLSPEEATALAESKGFVARVGTIDGQPQAVTMDFREDRFTFEVTGGVVVACTYG
jgi:membrane-bound lytic murein transglycosylase B